MTQKTLVLGDLKRCKKGITSLRAIEKYGITRLAAVIHELRDDGIEITTDTVPVKNRYGETRYVANYKLRSK